MSQTAVRYLVFFALVNRKEQVPYSVCRRYYLLKMMRATFVRITVADSKF